MRDIYPNEIMRHNTRSTYPNELMHFGILGMKWGVRRYQNKDGSLTPEGRRRLGYDPNFARSHVDSKLSNYRGSVNELQNEATRITKLGNDLTEEYKKSFKEMNLQNCPKLKKQIDDAVSEVKSYTDDKDTIKFTIEDCIMEHITEHVSPKAAKVHAECTAAIDKWWNDVYELANNISINEGFGDNVKMPENANTFKKYGTGQEFVKSVLDNHLDTSWMSFMFRHLEDYWIRDLDECYDAEDRIKDEYMKLMKKTEG